MDDNAPITWGQLKRAVERAVSEADAYSDTSDAHKEIAQSTARIALAHLESGLDKEQRDAELRDAIAENRPVDMT